jgi:hypothetical protein
VNQKKYRILRPPSERSYGHLVKNWIIVCQIYKLIHIILSGFGRKEVVEYLLQCGADVHAKDDG